MVEKKPTQTYTFYLFYFFFLFVKLFPFLTDNIALSVSGQFRNCRAAYIIYLAHTLACGHTDTQTATEPRAPIEFPIFRAVYPGDDSGPVQTENWPLHVYIMYIMYIYYTVCPRKQGTQEKFSCCACAVKYTIVITF